MITNSIKPFEGVHCETTATGSLLNHIGIELSEPMLFGLGEGLGYIFWKMKSMDFPFLGGRIKSGLITYNLAKNLNLTLSETETTSAAKAWEKVQELLQSGKIVGLKLDCYHLEYFTSHIHFAGHYVAIYGYDEKNAYLIDTKSQGTQVKTSLSSLEKARGEKGPMASKNLFYTLEKGTEFNLKNSILDAIRTNASDYLNPPITNIGYKGIMKSSVEIRSWFKNSKNRKDEFKSAAYMMEEAGTGGALFRNLYRDFLKESAILTGSEIIMESHKKFIEIADEWSGVSELFERIGETEDQNLVVKASLKLQKIAGLEKTAMEKLILV